MVFLYHRSTDDIEAEGSRRLDSDVQASCLHSFLGNELPTSSSRVDHLFSSGDDLNKMISLQDWSCDKRRQKLRNGDTLYGNISVPLRRGACLTIDEIVQGYQVLFERTAAFSYTNFLGVPMQQDPSDAFAIMDLIWRSKPDLIVELGTAGGGSAFFYGIIMTAYNPNGHIITIDPMRKYDWNLRNVHKVCPHCIDARKTPFWKNAGVIDFHNQPVEEMVDIVRQRIIDWKSTNVLVIDDSNHLTSVVLKNLRLFSQFVSVGSYFLVQDMKMSRLLRDPRRKVSPSTAASLFLKSPRGQSFYVDRSFEYYFYTQHAGGFLKRKSNDTFNEIASEEEILNEQMYTLK